MISMSNIVVIDDEENELIDIQKAFFLAGIPCLPIHYQYDMTNNKSGIDHIDSRNLYPRIIVTDLNLRSSSALNAQNLAVPIVDLLKKLEPEGPFLLVFWSGLSEEIDNVMNYIQERFYNKAENPIPLPIHYASIKKSDYVGTSNTKYLKEKITEIIKDSKLFNALISWENRVVKAAKETTNSLYKLTKPKDLDEGENYQNTHTCELQKILAVIGNEAVGQINAGNVPGTALDLGLAPVLNDHLFSMCSDNDKWSEAVPSIGKKVKLENDIIPALNSFYHTEKIPPDFPKNCKGVFVKLSEEILSDEEKKKKFEQKIGRTISEIFKDEFLSQRKIENMDKNARRQLRSEAEKHTILGFLEISADCDQAQKKVKLHKYLLAALIPDKYKEFTLFEHNGITRKVAHDGIYRTPDILIDKEKYILKLSFRYQIGTVPDTNVHNHPYSNSWFGESMFRLREQILTEISFKYAQYSSRPGIISFY